MDLTIPTTWHAGPFALPPDLVNYFPRGIWLLISSYFDARHLIHALSDDKILALWVKQIDLRVITREHQSEIKAVGHRYNPFGGPALIEYYGGCRKETWCDYGKRHRLDGPAEIQIYPNGDCIEIWYTNGKRHRTDGPASITICSDGRRTEIWYENGKYHRLDGPAYVYIYSDGKRKELWYQDDVQIPPPAKKSTQHFSCHF